MKTLFLILTLGLLACGQKTDDAIPVALQLDFAVAQQAVNNIQPAWQKAQGDYGAALAALNAFCRAHGDKAPGADPTNGKRLACVAKPPSKGSK